MTSDPSGSAESIQHIPSALVAATAKSTLLPTLNAKSEFSSLTNQGKEVKCDLALIGIEEKGGGSIGILHEGLVAGGNRWSTGFFRHRKR